MKSFGNYDIGYKIIITTDNLNSICKTFGKNNYIYKIKEENYV